MLDLVLVMASAALYPVLHLGNTWAFRFAEVTPHICLIYLPAFLRMLNVLVLGKLRGTAATALGGLLLMGWFGDSSTIGYLNVACSAAGPLVAVFMFRLYFGRGVDLRSLRDLLIVTFGYCVSNALIHHAVWSVFAPSHLVSSSQMFWMMLGDFNGTLIGAYLLKWSTPRLGLADRS